MPQRVPRTDERLPGPGPRGRLVGPAARGRLVLAALAVALVAVGCQAAPAPTASGTTTAMSVASPLPSVTTPAASGQKVRAAELRRIAVPEVGFSQPVTPLSTVDMGDAIDPPLFAPGRPSAPVRVSDKGVKPSSDAADTVYVGCHTSAIHGPEQYPCDSLTRAVQAGFHVVVTTDAGTLTYTVTHTRSIPYADFAGDAETWRVEARRLVLVMCDVADGKPTHANYVIYAGLAS